MSDDRYTPPEELKAIVASLDKVRLASSRVDRDRLMFLAGASSRVHSGTRPTPGAFGFAVSWAVVATVAAAVMGLALVSTSSPKGEPAITEVAPANPIPDRVHGLTERDPMTRAPSPMAIRRLLLSAEDPSRSLAMTNGGVRRRSSNDVPSIRDAYKSWGLTR